MNKKDAQLNGHDNKRLTAFRPTDSEETAAWANENTRQKHSGVVIPKPEGVSDSKNWVDNGSKL